MTDLNDVKLIGRIVKDSVLEQNADYKYAKFSIAVNHDVKTANGDWESVPTFVDLAIFNVYAEKMYPHLRKGTLVLVQGYIKQRQWEKDGQKITSLGIAVSKIQLLASAKSSDKSSDNSETSNTVINESDVSAGNVEPSDFDMDTQGVF